MTVSRRDFLKGLSGVSAGTGLAIAPLPIASFSQSANPAEALSANGLIPEAVAPVPTTPDDALAELIAGNRRFVTRRRLLPHQDTSRLTEVAETQAPFAAILSCADSRVVPEIVFDQGIGDLFVVRVAGNVAALEDVASEEYAVSLLHTPLVMVLGHAGCGAVTAALLGGKLPGALDSLIHEIQPAIALADAELAQLKRNQPNKVLKPGDRLTYAVKANVRLQTQRLLQSPIVSQAVDAGRLKVVGAYYDLATGVVSILVD
ncbi:carbonic anhydrase [Thermoleptolyngbya sp. M55_K2018_002]|uniref:carbonic anhydrase n=1 Tax=Thermoleptolyngbya sp. M55_K2018_002 TaxID=2747808 RepID=UPI0019E2E444|nr:carbonic anhydrase [Thermoleptolyngbya sp. M55_K2018_002]HIK42049.1 carbonic anhydrase [Thermoleptolyngbya sp. M55_K2018_002]